MCVKRRNINSKFNLVWPGMDLTSTNSQAEWRHNVKWALLSMQNGPVSMCHTAACDFFFSVTYRDPFVYHCSRPIRMIYKCIRFNYIGCSSFHHCVLQDSICNVFGACKSFLNGALRKTLQTFSFENICGSLRRLQIFSKRRPPPPRAAEGAVFH